jgi:hypothetical protein
VVVVYVKAPVAVRAARTNRADPALSLESLLELLNRQPVPISEILRPDSARAGASRLAAAGLRDAILLEILAASYLSLILLTQPAPRLKTVGTVPGLTEILGWQGLPAARAGLLGQGHHVGGSEALSACADVRASARLAVFPGSTAVEIEVREWLSLATPRAGKLVHCQSF